MEDTSQRSCLPYFILKEKTLSADESVIVGYKLLNRNYLKAKAT